VAAELDLHKLDMRMIGADSSSRVGFQSANGVNSKLPIQPSVVDGFRYVFSRDGFFVSQVGDGAADAEDLVVGSGGEAQLRHGLPHGQRATPVPRSRRCRNPALSS
jgi:hypothetical protein